MSSLVLTTELALAGLLGFLAIRLLFLYRTGPANTALTGMAQNTARLRPWQDREPGIARDKAVPAASPAPAERAFREQKLTLITELHILYSLQERDARDHGVNLVSTSAAVHGFVTAWVYGAACSLVQAQARHSELMKRQVANLVARKLSIPERVALDTIEGLAGCSARLACFRCGLEGAEHWQRQRFVPGDVALYRAITANAFI